MNPRLLTTNELCRVIKRTPMMVYIYRTKGRRKQTREGSFVRSKLPQIVIPGGIRPPIRFDWSAVEPWLKNNGIAFDRSVLKAIVEHSPSPSQ